MPNMHRSRQIIAVAKDFCPHFPILARNVFVQLFPTNFLSQRSWKLLLAWPQKNYSRVFETALEKRKSNGGRHHFYPYFQRFCPDFPLIKTFEDSLASPPPTPLQICISDYSCLKNNYVSLRICVHVCASFSCRKVKLYRSNCFSVVVSDV